MFDKKIILLTSLLFIAGSSYIFISHEKNFNEINLANNSDDLIDYDLNEEESIDEDDEDVEGSSDFFIITTIIIIAIIIIFLAIKKIIDKKQETKTTIKNKTTIETIITPPLKNNKNNKKNKDPNLIKNKIDLKKDNTIKNNEESEKPKNNDDIKNNIDNKNSEDNEESEKPKNNDDIKNDIDNKNDEESEKPKNNDDIKNDIDNKNNEDEKNKDPNELNFEEYNKFKEIQKNKEKIEKELNDNIDSIKCLVTNFEKEIEGEYNRLSNNKTIDPNNYVKNEYIIDFDIYAPNNKFESPNKEILKIYRFNIAEHPELFATIVINFFKIINGHKSYNNNDSNFLSKNDEEQKKIMFLFIATIIEPFLEAIKKRTYLIKSDFIFLSRKNSNLVIECAFKSLVAKIDKHNLAANSVFDVHVSRSPIFYSIFNQLIGKFFNDKIKFHYFEKK